MHSKDLCPTDVQTFDGTWLEFANWWTMSTWERMPALARLPEQRGQDTPKRTTNKKKRRRKRMVLSPINSRPQSSSSPFEGVDGEAGAFPSIETAARPYTAISLIERGYTPLMAQSYVPRKSAAFPDQRAQRSNAPLPNYHHSAPAVLNGVPQRGGWRKPKSMRRAVTASALPAVGM